MIYKNTVVSEKKFYSLNQIIMHWLVALLVFYQLANNGDIKKTYQLFLDTGVWANHLSSKTILHIITGFIILIAMIFRLTLRLKTRVPSLPLEVPYPLNIIAKLSHFFLYSLLFLMPISGFIGWFLGLRFAIEVHSYSSKILLTLILIHICAAIFHEGVLGNKILQRMVQFKEKPKH
jgi:cytochrome b561